MAQYMLLVYEEEEVDAAGQAQRDEAVPVFLELHRSLREAGLLVNVKALRPPDSATTVRVRGDATEIVDGPHAVTKEMLAGFYLVECADLDEALALAARIPPAGWGTVEVRPVVPVEQWSEWADRLGLELTDEDRRNLA
jgi:hypothetical protein